MSQWNNQQNWPQGGQYSQYPPQGPPPDKAYNNGQQFPPQAAPYPGPTPQYGQQYVQPPQQQYGNGGEKNPYEGDRFKPKKKINDPILLILFILQVRGRSSSQTRSVLMFLASSLLVSSFFLLSQSVVGFKMVV